jgi:hypothetical protein
VTLEHVGFLDRSQAPGRYRVRYVGRYEPLDGSRDDPLASDWLNFELTALEVDSEVAEPLPVRRVDLEQTGLRAFLSWSSNWWHNLLCFFRRLFGGEPCDGIFIRNVDEARTEVMSDAPPGFEAWNGTYGWRARFRSVVDQSACSGYGHDQSTAGRGDHRRPEDRMGDRHRGRLEQHLQTVLPVLLLQERLHHRRQH